MDIQLFQKIPDYNQEFYLYRELQCLQKKYYGVCGTVSEDQSGTDHD